MRKIFLISIAFISTSIIGLGQTEPVRNQVSSIDKIMLPSPEVTAMQRYGNWPMGNYTGTSNINIPLFQLASGKLKLPISLAYSSSGTRQNDVGGNMGLGWVLNAGGSVNRNMKGGQPDEHITSTGFGVGYWYKFPFPPSSYFGNDYQLEWQWTDFYSNGKYDAQPDVFTYSGAGINGKFVFDTARQAHFLPYNKHVLNTHMDVTSLYNPMTQWTIYDPITGFTIKDENGTIYQFLDYEFASSDPKTYSNEEVSPAIPSDPDYAGSYISTWHLTNIISADKKDTIHFSYDLVDISYQVHGGSRIASSYKVQGNRSPSLAPYIKSRTVVYNSIRSKRLRKIEFKTGYLQFYEGSPRKYMEGGANLDSMVLYQKEGQRVKGFAFDYRYLQGTSLLPSGDVPGNASINDVRILLYSVTEKGTDGTTLPSYKFDYEHTLPLPSKILGGGDKFGYANGKYYNGIGDSIHTYVHSYALDNFDQSYGALMKLMKPNFNYAKQAMLTKIDYPTGGTTLFTYEPHYKLSYSSYDIQVCDGNASVEFTGVQFAPRIPNDPDAPPFPKFKISSTTSATVTVSLDSRHNNFPMFYYIEIRDSATNALKFTYYKSSVYCDTYTNSPYPTCTKNVSFPPGTYYIIPKNTGQTYSGSAGDIYCKVSIPPVNCHTESVQVADTVSVGGVRIKNTIDIDSVTGKKLGKFYEYAEDLSPSQFTGVFLTQSDYNYYQLISGGVGGDEYYSIESEKVLSSNSIYPLTDVSGFYIGYGKVREKQVDMSTGLTNGYTEYEYSNDIDDGIGETAYNFPAYPPYVAQSWKRGNLLRTKHFRMDGESSVLLKDEKINYTNLREKFKIHGEAFYTKVHILPNSDWPIVIGSEYQAPRYVLHTPFYYTSSYQVKDTVTLTEYADNGDILITKTAYEYDTTTLLASKVVVWNNGAKEKIITEIKRPFDYNGLTASDNLSVGVKLMRDSHNWSPEIEKSTYRSTITDQNKRLISSQFTHYLQNIPLKQKVSVLENGVALTDFSKSSVQSGALTIDSRYIPVVLFNGYDNYSNLKEQQKADDVSNSYLWGYNNSYPIAEIINAKSSDVFHTSFEEGDGNSTAGDSKSGKKSKTGGYSKSLTGLTNGTYLFTYWQKSGSNWVYLESEMSVSAGVCSLSVSGQVDEIRLYPKKAKMRTYTYEPLVGITSICDDNNKMVYYEYDALGRLSFIRDDDRSIVKRVCYNYTGQPDFCTTSPVWVSTGTTRCQPCPANSTYTNNIQEHQEKDTNPNSPTYNTMRWVSDGVNSNCSATATWQNTATAVRCKKNGSNQNTGEQEQEQKDMNPCSATYNTTRWIVVGTNLTACPLPSVNVTIKSTNYTPNTGFTAKYTNKTTLAVYTFTIPGTGGLQTLGTIPSGTYDLIISKTGNNTNLTFGSGCGSQSTSGKSATFYNISVSSTSCNSIYIDNIL